MSQKIPFVSLIEFIRSKLSVLVAHVSRSLTYDHVEWMVIVDRFEKFEPQVDARRCNKKTFHVNFRMGVKGTAATQPRTLADPADRLGQGKFWRRGPNLHPFSTFPTDLGHFILKLLNLDIFFYFMFNLIFIRFFCVGGEGANRPLCAFG